MNQVNETTVEQILENKQTNQNQIFHAFNIGIQNCIYEVESLYYSDEKYKPCSEFALKLMEQLEQLKKPLQ